MIPVVGIDPSLRVSAAVELDAAGALVRALVYSASARDLARGEADAFPALEQLRDGQSGMQGLDIVNACY